MNTTTEPDTSDADGHDGKTDVTPARGWDRFFSDETLVLPLDFDTGEDPPFEIDGGDALASRRPGGVDRQQELGVVDQA